MKTIEFTSNWGNFDYRMQATVGDDINAATIALCLQGLANIGYRAVGSNVEKELGIKSKKAGGMGRTGLAYSSADGERINAVVSKKLTELEAENAGALKPLALSFAVTGPHTFGEASGSGTKEAAAVWEEWQKTDATKSREEQDALFAARLKKIGLTPEDFDDDKAVVGIAKALREARAAAAEETKKGLLGV